MARLTVSLAFLCAFIVISMARKASGHECRAERYFRIMDAILRSRKYPVYHKRPVAFFARFRKDFSMRSNSRPLVFDDVITNVGSGYNKHTGIFTCPVRGVYHFQWTMLPYHRNSFFSELLLNGKIIMRNFASAQASSRTTSNMVTLSLNKGDRVWIRKHNSISGTTNGGVYAAFQGFIL